MARNENVWGQEGDRGPGWWDVGEYSRELMERWHVGVTFVFVPPVRRFDGKGFSSWCVAATVRGRGALKEWESSAQESWGAGGSWKTAPAALHAALRRIETTLIEREKDARAQARF